ncbi:DUF2914 domain-containing protein [Candidatus Kaiserbacteria bacterium]|nr:DUF2914 domain-containing protein [Candidatus Kaiserbacteria bacterium]MCB9811617.1 DUF2914 domain-containing protein [Candidatus Nomurabacteria bacterium]
MIDRLKTVTSSPKFSKFKHHWLTLAFILGFVVDNLTLNRVDQLFDNLVLLAYVLIAMGSIIYLYAGIASKMPESWVPYSRKYAPLLIQYAFGGLLSGMLIFYGRSGSWSESWPFLLLILGVIYGNETIKDRSSRLIFNLAIFFVGLFSYVVLVIPVVTGHMGPWIFVGSGLLALIIMQGFIRVLRWIVPNFINLHLKSIVFTVGCIFAGLNFLYFTNIIPPIPLSLKEVGIYHSVVRFDNGDYQVSYEKGPWWRFWKQSDTVFHPTAGGNIYCFAKVFAPTRLSTDIYHSWDYYDEEKEEWVQHLRLSYPISGGRSSGYRGYTFIENFREGEWRCSVETERGQVLGQEKFTVDYSGQVGELETRVE